MNQDILRVLLIEDNPGDARLIREHLREADDIAFTLTLSNTLKDGLHELATQPFDIVLLDLSLPDSFGVETIQTVCAAVPTMPVVVLTGFDDKTVGVQAVQLGAQDYLVKDETNSKLLTRTIRYAIERNRTEMVLRQNQEEYRSLIDDVFSTSNVGVLILDRNFKVVWLNGAIEVYFGIPREELFGQDKRLLIEDKIKCIFEDVDGFAENLLSSYRDNAFDRRLECHVTPGENRLERWLEHWSQPIRAGMYAGGRIEHYTDITERIQMEASEREKAQKLAAAEERQRLARELHDSVSQSLFTATVMSESALRQWDVNPQKARDLMDQLYHITHTALSEMRLLLVELRPASLAQQNLTALIEQLSSSIQSRTNMRIVTELDEIAKLNPEVQVALYRIIQEALNNVTKHAQARQVHVRLAKDAHQIQLSIADDGKGFDLNDIEPTSLGVGIMRERAESIDASFEIESQRGSGTQIRVILKNEN